MPRIRTAIALALLVAGIAVTAVGCGGGSSTVKSFPPTPQQRVEAKAEEEAPKGASPFLRSIYRKFPPPQPDPKVKGSGKAISKGEASCKGKTPLEVKEQFEGETHLLPEQETMVAKLPQFEKSADSSPDFPAGQLAALVYEGTIHHKVLANYGYQGCIHSLARSLEHRLAPR